MVDRSTTARTPASSSSTDANRARGLEQLKGSAMALGALIVALAIAGGITGHSAYDDAEGTRALAFASAVGPWWITAGLLTVARAIILVGFWRLAADAD